MSVWVKSHPRGEVECPTDLFFALRGYLMANSTSASRKYKVDPSFRVICKFAKRYVKMYLLIKLRFGKTAKQVSINRC